MQKYTSGLFCVQDRAGPVGSAGVRELEPPLFPILGGLSEAPPPGPQRGPPLQPLPWGLTVVFGTPNTTMRPRV